jgi:hypothetical protein
MDQYTIVANHLEAVINSTFAAEGVVARHDVVHESLGQQGPIVGIAPVRDLSLLSDRVVQNTYVEVRYLDHWQKMVDPTQAVDPRSITAKADRLRVALRDALLTPSGELWFFSVDETTYPNDPTGNKTRFYMVIRAWGNNSSLVETIE